MPDPLPPDPATPRPERLPAAIARALEEQQEFERARATVLGRGAERLTAPLGAVFARLVPPEALRAALAQADALAVHTLPASLTAHDRNDIDACDAAALRAQGWAQGLGAAAGGAAGLMGAAGLALDIPATIGLAARTVRATAVAYGFAGRGPGERAFRLAVLELATTLASERRAETTGRINRLAAELARPETGAVLETGGQWLADKVVERIARQLGVNLGARKAGQVVPLVGGAVAAAVNASFQADVGRSARWAYRQRWLMARKVLPGPDDGAAASGAGRGH